MRREQPFEVEGGSVVGAEEPVATPACFRVLTALVVRARFDDFDPLPLRDGPDGIDERQAVDLAHELDRVAGSRTSEAVIETAFLVHVEARRLLLVERTEARVRASAFRQLHPLAD